MPERTIWRDAGPRGSGAPYSQESNSGAERWARGLLVYFNPTTKAVKVQRPSEPEPRTAKPQTSTFAHALTNRGVGASQACRYFYDGKEYSPDEAARLVKERDTVGWRWIPK